MFQTEGIEQLSFSFCTQESSSVTLAFGQTLKVKVRNIRSYFTVYFGFRINLNIGVDFTSIQSSGYIYHTHVNYILHQIRTDAVHISHFNLYLYGLLLHDLKQTLTLRAVDMFVEFLAFCSALLTYCKTAPAPLKLLKLLLKMVLHVSS